MRRMTHALRATLRATGWATFAFFLGVTTFLSAVPNGDAAARNGFALIFGLLLALGAASAVFAFPPKRRRRRR